MSEAGLGRQPAREEERKKEIGNGKRKRKLSTVRDAIMGTTTNIFAQNT